MQIPLCVLCNRDSREAPMCTISSYTVYVCSECVKLANALFARRDDTDYLKIVKQT